MELKYCPGKAKEALSRAKYPVNKLVLIHTGIFAAVGLGISLLSWLLSLGIGQTGGLGGLGDRAVLETVQQLLQAAQLLAAPFWNIGLVMASLQLIRGLDFGPGTLLEGFRRFGPVLRMNLLRWLIYMGVVMLASQIASTVYMMTPWGMEFLAMMEEIAASGTTDLTQVLTQEQLLNMALKMLPFLAGACLLLLVPVLYRLRMMDYVLMEHPHLGAFFALRLSLFMTRKNCVKLFKLDLHYWWFYVLEALTVALCYGDLLLSLAGVQTAVDASLLSILFYAAGLLAQLGLYGWKKGEVMAAYSFAYEALLPPPVEDA